MIFRQKITLIIFILVPFLCLKAQEFNFGLKGGVNLNSIGELRHYGTNSGGGPFADPTITLLFKADSEIGNQYGVFAEVDFGFFFIRPELNMTSLKNSYPLSKNPSLWTATRTDIPILIGRHLNNYLSVFAGPVFSSISEFEIDGVENPLTYEKNTIGINIGISAEYGRFGVDLRFEQGIKSIEEQEVFFDVEVYGTNKAKLEVYNTSLISLNLNIKLFGFNPGESVSGRSFNTRWRNHRNLR